MKRDHSWNRIVDGVYLPRMAPHLVNPLKTALNLLEEYINEGNPDKVLAAYDALDVVVKMLDVDSLREDVP